MNVHQRCIKYAFDRGYRVQGDGSVLSPKGKRLSLHPNNRGGYLRFGVNCGDIRGKVYVHRLAAYQNFGEQSFRDGVQCRHVDGNGTNNSPSNIALGTVRQNAMDKPKSTRLRTAKKAAKARRKLTDEQLAEFRRDRAAGMKYKQLMAKYGISKATVSYIVNGKTYKGS